MKRIIFALLPVCAAFAMFAGIASAHHIDQVSADCTTGLYSLHPTGFNTTPTIHVHFSLDGGPTVNQDQPYGVPITGSFTSTSLLNTGNHTLVISADWNDGPNNPGSLDKTTVQLTNCGAVPPPPPAVNCPDGYTKDPGSTSTVLLCTRTVTQTVTVYGTPSCPSGTTLLSSGQGSVTCGTTVYGTPTCPSGSTQSSSGQGYVVCSTTVFGSPTCPAGSTLTSSGQGFVVCNTTTTLTNTVNTTTPGQTITNTVLGTPPACTAGVQTASGDGWNQCTVTNNLPGKTITKKSAPQIIRQLVVKHEKAKPVKPRVITRTRTIVKHEKAKPVKPRVINHYIAVPVPAGCHYVPAKTGKGKVVCTTTAYTP